MLESSIYDKKDYSKFYEDMSEKSLKIDSESSISNKSFSNYIHYLCKECHSVPEIDIFDNYKLKVKCKCQNSSNKEIFIKDFYKYLFDKESFRKEYFKCESHKKNLYFIAKIVIKIFVYIAKRK